jgi:hypothetical protein
MHVGKKCTIIGPEMDATGTSVATARNRASSSRYVPAACIFPSWHALTAARDESGMRVMISARSEIVCYWTIFRLSARISLLKAGVSGGMA